MPDQNGAWIVDDDIAPVGQEAAAGWPREEFTAERFRHFTKSWNRDDDGNSTPLIDA